MKPGEFSRLAVLVVAIATALAVQSDHRQPAEALRAVPLERLPQIQIQPLEAAPMRLSLARRTLTQAEVVAGQADAS